MHEPPVPATSLTEQTHSAPRHARTRCAALAVLLATLLATPLLAEDPPTAPPTAPIALPEDAALAAVFEHPVDGAAPPEALVAVRKRLHAEAVIRARFTEEKKIAVLRKPLRSEGSLILCPARGLYRRMTKPFAQELTVTREEILTRDGERGEKRIDLGGQPAAAAFVEALLLVASGDAGMLAERFELAFTGTEAAWILGLRPRDPVMRKLIASMTLAGRGVELDLLIVAEAKGDVTRTRFHEVQLGLPLTPDEERTCFGVTK